MNPMILQTQVVACVSVSVILDIDFRLPIFLDHGCIALVAVLKQNIKQCFIVFANVAGRQDPGR